MKKYLIFLSLSLRLRLRLWCKLFISFLFLKTCGYFYSNFVFIKMIFPIFEQLSILLSHVTTRTQFKVSVLVYFPIVIPVLA